MQRIHQQSNQQVQREVETEEEQLQTKPVDNIQRQELSVDEQLQMKPMVQRLADGGMTASADVEAGIQRARGGGQPLADSVRELMEQAFGVDFSPVRVHTDAVLRKCSQCEEKEKVQLHADEETQLTGDDLHEQVQLHTNVHNGAKSIQQLATKGFSGSPTTLPHLNQIQQSFGVNLSQVQAYMGSDAAAACQQMGADAYASGNQIAFKQAPSVELAAHEAAHVVQQASGKVQLSGGVGKVGDKYEQQADDVAARVGAGQSAGDLFREYSKEHSSVVTLTDTQMKNSDDANQEEALYAQAGVFDRGPLPPRKTPPNQDKCRQILHDIIVYLIAGILERVVSADIGKEVTRGLPERYRQLKKDTYGLYTGLTQVSQLVVGA